ncbi:MAG: hypothetical protein IJ688_11080 [Treponema sp.]|nr:hypothetical protein [Treponema sp.]
MKTIREVMDMPVTNLELSVRCCNCLKNMKINKLCELTALSEEDFSHVRNMGNKSFALLKDLLDGMGLCFSMTDRDWLQWGLMNKKWILSH